MQSKGNSKNFNDGTYNIAKCVVCHKLKKGTMKMKALDMGTFTVLVCKEHLQTNNNLKKELTDYFNIDYNYFQAIN